LGEKKMKITYENRSAETQVKIKQLRRCYPYSLSFYEKMTDREIHAFHYSKLGEMAKMSINSIKSTKKEDKSPMQLALF
jgi:hypothetical protein